MIFLLYELLASAEPWMPSFTSAVNLINRPWSRAHCPGSDRASFTVVAHAHHRRTFERAVAIMERLRAPGGCPWDREQTFDSIKPYTLEETYEVLEAIDNRDWPELAGELGDLLLQVLFYSEMAKEQGSFSIDDVLDRLSSKLIDRHPHVFGDVKADTSAEVKRNWEALKARREKETAAKTAGGEAARRRAATERRCWPEFLPPCRRCSRPTS